LRLRPILFGLAVLGAAACLAEPALAHAILLASRPAANGSVPAGPVALEFRFNSRIDRTRSALKLMRPDRTQTDLPIADDGASPDILHASAELPPGHYVVRWQVLATDGHITRGDVPFSVGP
jgi:methionine-rich copper-binding protein CopC